MAAKKPQKKKAPATRKKVKKAEARPKAPTRKKAAVRPKAPKKVAVRPKAPKKAAARPKAPRKAAVRPKLPAVAKPGASSFDVEGGLERLDRWCQAQRESEVRLLRLPPFSEDAIDRIPSLLTSFPFPLPTPYDPARFVLPRGYRELLRRAGGLRVEYREHPDAEWRAWPVVTIYRPADCARAHSGATDTLADSWTVLGTGLDDRAFSTTEFISFADAGFSVEASRWCFYTGGEPGAEPSIYIEDNDFECLLGKYVDTGEWVSSLSSPVFKSFEDWFTAVVEVVCARRFDPEEKDAIVNAIIERGGKG